MADPVAPAPSPAPVEPAPAPAPAPSPTPAPAASQPKEEKTVPYDRFKEVNDELAEIKRKQKEKADADAIAAGNHEQVINELRPQAERATSLETVIKSVVANELATIPAERHSLIPDLPPEKQLEWITKNREFLTGKKTDVNRPVAPTDGAKPGDQTTFTKAQINDPVFYAANRDAIVAAVNAGRIVD